MARLSTLEGKRAQRTDHGGRYLFDAERLTAHFGGLEHLNRLAATFGVPLPPPTARDITRTYLPVLVELAHRMRKPLDLYDFLLERR